MATFRVRIIVEDEFDMDEWELSDNSPEDHKKDAETMASDIRRDFLCSAFVESVTSNY